MTKIPKSGAHPALPIRLRHEKIRWLPRTCRVLAIATSLNVVAHDMQAESATRDPVEDAALACTLTDGAERRASLVRNGWHSMDDEEVAASARIIAEWFAFSAAIEGAELAKLVPLVDDLKQSIEAQPSRALNVGWPIPFQRFGHSAAKDLHLALLPHEGEMPWQLCLVSLPKGYATKGFAARLDRLGRTEPNPDASTRTVRSDGMDIVEVVTLKTAVPGSPGAAEHASAGDVAFELVTFTEPARERLVPPFVTHSMINVKFSPE
jgi:hypothetical protein